MDNFKRYITECKDSFPSIYNEFILDNYISLENGTSSPLCAVIKIIDKMSNVQVAIIIFSYHSDITTLRISNIEVHQEFKGQYIGSFLILLALQFVYNYSFVINMSSMQITVDLDDDSKRSRQPNNIYINCGFHYYDMEDFPEMGTSLSHATRICENYFKSKITNTNKNTIFNKNISYFQPEEERGREESKMHYDEKNKLYGGFYDINLIKRSTLSKEKKDLSIQKKNNLRYDLINQWNMNIINLKFFSVLKFIRSIKFDVYKNEKEKTIEKPSNSSGNKQKSIISINRKKSQITNRRTIN